MKKEFINKLTSYLEISNFERRGVLLLLFILLAVAGYYALINRTQFTETSISEEDFNKFEKRFNESLRSEPIEKVSSFLKKRVKELQPFNPNVNTYKEMVEKGVPSQVASNIVNYRDKGGSFKSKLDLKKLYKVDDKMYLLLYAKIIIDSTKNEAVGAKIKNDKLAIEKLNVELNSSTADELSKLSGIGEVLSQRIIKYRNLLGGFYSILQLKEVYGLTEEVIAANENALSINESLILKMNINSVGYNELIKHPYIDSKIASKIIGYRKQHGEFESINQIQNMHFFKGKNIDRILLYLDLK